jgi:hypothetical protein
MKRKKLQKFRDWLLLSYYLVNFVHNTLRFNKKIQWDYIDPTVSPKKRRER